MYWLMWVEGGGRVQEKTSQSGLPPPQQPLLTLCLYPCCISNCIPSYVKILPREEKQGRLLKIEQLTADLLIQLFASKILLKSNWELSGKHWWLWKYWISSFQFVTIQPHLSFCEMCPTVQLHFLEAQTGNENSLEDEEMGVVFW